MNIKNEFSTCAYIYIAGPAYSYYRSFQKRCLSLALAICGAPKSLVWHGIMRSKAFKNKLKILSGSLT